MLSPMAAEIEMQTIAWLADFLGYPTTAGGVLVSGGNVANFVGFLAGRQAKAPWDIKTRGVVDHGRHLITYVSAETHTWIDKAAELFGQGRESVRWIPVDDDLRMRVDLLREQIQRGPCRRTCSDHGRRCRGYRRHWSGGSASGDRCIVS